LAGFRPFFLLSAVWAAAAVPIWIAWLSSALPITTGLPIAVWHVHEMVFGYGAATVAGFLLTAIPNWTGRLPLRGWSLGWLVLLWGGGRLVTLVSASTGPGVAAAVDLAFPLCFAGAAAREIVAGRNWRNLPMMGALLLLLGANALIHAEALGLSFSADIGNRLGVATLLMLIALVGGRIIPSFTRNWLAKTRPGSNMPAPFGWLDRGALAITVLALACWVAIPGGITASVLELGAGTGLWIRLLRWRGFSTGREPLVWVLHLGYFWLGLGLVLLGISGIWRALPQSAAVHALTVGAIGTMTLAVMTRATLGHTGQTLSAGPGTTVIYAAITLAALFRLVAPLGGNYLLNLGLATAAWSGAFGLFVLLYAGILTRSADM
jgi:uncharacterized protein involved in response to NO